MCVSPSAAKEESARVTTHLSLGPHFSQHFPQPLHVLCAPPPSLTEPSALFTIVLLLQAPEGVSKPCYFLRFLVSSSSALLHDKPTALITPHALPHLQCA